MFKKWQVFDSCHKLTLTVTVIKMSILHVFDSCDNSIYPKQMHCFLFLYTGWSKFNRQNNNSSFSYGDTHSHEPARKSSTTSNKSDKMPAIPVHKNPVSLETAGVLVQGRRRFLSLTDDNLTSDVSFNCWHIVHRFHSKQMSVCVHVTCAFLMFQESVRL